MADEMTATIDGETLVLRIPMDSPPRPSASGKTLVVASSHGNRPMDIEIQGRPITVGVNAYIRR